MRIRQANKNQVLGALISIGSSYQDFAERHGYKPNTVCRTVSRYCAGGGRELTGKGKLARAILAALELEIFPESANHADDSIEAVQQAQAVNE